MDGCDLPGRLVVHAAEGQTRTAASAVNEAETEPSGRCAGAQQECIIYNAAWVGETGVPKAILVTCQYNTVE
jgi:hypothetical protein